MRSKSILVTGAKGQLGSEIKILSENSPHNFTFIDIDELDLCNCDNVKNFLTSNKFDWIVNCAAYTNVDGAESNQDDAYKVNVEAVQNILNGIVAVPARLIHISTDFVFDGNKSKPYDENDLPNPVSVYGRTKFEAEKLVLNSNANHIVIRTSWLYSPFGKNFVKTILRLAEEKDVIPVIYDQVGTPTYAKDLADVILKFIDNENSEGGVYHFSNEGVASWYDFAKEILGTSSSNSKVLPVSTEEFPTAAKRPHFSVMSKKKIKDKLHVEIPYWKDSLQKVLKEIKGDNN